MSRKNLDEPGRIAFPNPELEEFFALLGGESREFRILEDQSVGLNAELPKRSQMQVHEQVLRIFARPSPQAFTHLRRFGGGPKHPLKERRTFLSGPMQRVMPRFGRVFRSSDIQPRVSLGYTGC